MRGLLSLDETRRSPLLKGSYVSLSRPFRQGAAIEALIREGLLHPHLRERIPESLSHLYGHQERAGRQPRILLTNVKQLELLLTRQHDIELFAGARLDFLVFDEAHTFTGALGAETACLIRRLRAFCHADPARTTCVATSATIVDQGDPQAGRSFAARFFGVASDNVTTVGEDYEAEVWAEPRFVPPAPADDTGGILDRTVLAVEDDPAAGPAVRQVYRELAGDDLGAGGWPEALHEALSRNEIVFRLAPGRATTGASESPPVVASIRAWRAKYRCISNYPHKIFNNKTRSATRLPFRCFASRTESHAGRASPYPCLPRGVVPQCTVTEKKAGAGPVLRAMAERMPDPVADARRPGRRRPRARRSLAAAQDAMAERRARRIQRMQRPHPTRPTGSHLPQDSLDMLVL